MGICVGVGVTSDNVYGNENKILKKKKYIIFSVTHAAYQSDAHADNVDKLLLLLLFELAAYLQRTMRKGGREREGVRARGGVGN